MIRVKLQGSGPEPIHIEFDAVPLEREDGFRSGLGEYVSFESAKQIALELHHGHLHGLVAGHHWYRQAGT